METERSPETDEIRKFEESVKYQEGINDVCLPWRKDHSKLGTNYCKAMTCLNGVARRFQKNDQYS